MTRGQPIYEEIPPTPSDLSASLRGVGYSVETALADLIDNSIAANATSVQLSFEWRGEASTVSCTDDGHGMDADELRNAMRLGRDPTKERAKSDLGRFGLGLKTASWSQCRVLTVRSKRLGLPTATRRWDLDHIKTSERWEVLTQAPQESERDLAPFADLTQGTIILWEKLDIFARTGVLKSSANFWTMVDRVQRHLAMTFHRFLESGRIKLTINGSPIKSWDPLMSGHSLRLEMPSDPIRSADGARSVAFTGYILPHRSQLSEEEYLEGAGPHGWIAGQGFYVYRGDRLILGGGWLGLGRSGRPWTPDHATRLTRISLDITNATDMDWSLDLMKSTAAPPNDFRERMAALADVMRRWSKSIKPKQLPRPRPQAHTMPVWVVEPGASPRIDRRHPTVQRALALAGNAAEDVRALLDLISDTVPIPAFESGRGSLVERTSAADDEVVKSAVNIVSALRLPPTVKRVEMQERAAEALARLKTHGRPDLVEKVLKILGSEP